MDPQLAAILWAVAIFLAMIAVAGGMTLVLHRLQRVPPADPQSELDPTTEALLEAIPMPAVAFGESMRRTYVNSAAEDSQGLVRRVSQQEWFQRALMSAFLDGRATSRSASVEYPEDIHVMALPGVRVVALIVDQTERFQTAALREDFIANASHELNTPTSAISLLAEAIGRTVEPGSPAEGFARSLKQESARLTALTQDIVRLSEVQQPTGGSPSRAFGIVVDMGSLVEDVVDSHRALADQVGVRLELRVGTEGEPADSFEVVGVRHQLDIAAGNLVENAIQHAPAGTAVRMTLKREDGDVALEVADSGPGVPPERAEQIFQRFYRMDAGRTRKVGGTGLGLSIARNTARNFGGEVLLKSRRAEGATFVMTLPAAWAGADTLDAERADYAQTPAVG